MSSSATPTPAAPTATTATPKISLSMVGSADAGCQTFIIENEDHTLGNPLRYLIMKNPAVQFCAYTIPHPSEDRIHLRIQTDGSITAVDALDLGLEQLTAVSRHVEHAFDGALAAGNYELVEGASV